MAITWTTLNTVTATGANFTINRITKIAPVSGGSLIAVDITAAYTNPPLIPIGFKAEIVAAPGLSAASVDDIQWGLESTDTSTNGDYTVTIQTYLGVPVDAMDNPIGSARVYMRLVTSTYAGNPTPGNELSLTWV